MYGCFEKQVELVNKKFTGRCSLLRIKRYFIKNLIFTQPYEGQFVDKTRKFFYIKNLEEPYDNLNQCHTRKIQKTLKTHTITYL